MIGKPLHEIKDAEQLDYIFEAAEEAYDALLHLRMLIQNFKRTGLGVIDGSEGEDDE